MKSLSPPQVYSMTIVLPLSENLGYILVFKKTNTALLAMGTL